MRFFRGFQPTGRGDYPWRGQPLYGRRVELYRFGEPYEQDVTGLHGTECERHRSVGFGAVYTQKYDYSVTWRQVVTSSGDYKNGVILRGDTLTIGNANQGYTPGIMAGYYMNVYNHGTVTDFRIYKSTSSKQLNMFNSASVSLQAALGKSIWYRASVSGSSKVTLKIEYSTDGETWHLGTSTTDEGGEFQQGATHMYGAWPHPKVISS